MSIPKKTLAWLAAALVLGAGSLAQAAIPRLISFQGRLTDNPARAVLSGPYSMTFRIADSPTGGTVCHTQTQTVTATDGLFSVVIGSPAGISTSCTFASQLYLEIQVGSDAAMTPRLAFTSAAFAFAAGGLVAPGTATIYTASNSAGGIPISNGVVNTNLNAALLDGHPWSDIAAQYTWSLYTIATACANAGRIVRTATCTYTTAGTCSAGCTQEGNTCTCNNSVFGYLRPQ